MENDNFGLSKSQNSILSDLVEKRDKNSRVN